MTVVHSYFVQLVQKLETWMPITGAFLLVHLSWSHRLSIIVQSISRIFFIKFDAFSHKLLYTFGLDKLTSYDVTIPGGDSKITWKLPTILHNIHTKFKVYSFSGTVFFNANSKFKIKIGLSMYKWRHVLLKSSVHVYSSIVHLLIFWSTRPHIIGVVR